MACRKLISSANKLNLSSVRCFTTSVRTFSSEKKDELAKVTHTGQVSSSSTKNHKKSVTQTSFNFFDISFYLFLGLRWKGLQKCSIHKLS